MVRTNTAILPGADAAVVRIKETRRALAMTLDGNGRYCAANPREGAKLIVAEAARNVVCVGAQADRDYQLSELRFARKTGSDVVVFGSDRRHGRSLSRV